MSSTDASGVWQAPLQLDLQGGNAPDLSIFSATDVVTAWFRIAPALRSDVVVRRIR